MSVFLYTSKCCNAAAKKEPCERSKDDKKAGKYGEATLGTWVCGVCGASCNVNRKLNPANKSK